MSNSGEFAETHDLLMSIIGGVPYGIIAIDMQGFITIINNRALNLLAPGKKVADAIDKKVISLLPRLPELKKHLKNCLKEGREDADFPDVSLGNRFLNIRVRKILNGMIITLADITEVKQAQTAMLSIMMEGQEQERIRLARELHDGIGPMLSTIKVTLTSIEEEFSDLHEELWEKFKKSYQLIDDVSSDLRSVSHNLLPKVLLDFGLVEALETLCEKTQKRKGLEVQFIGSGTQERLDRNIELSLYRICQELINNTLKYANASHITVQLIKTNVEIRLTYEDNGQGFDMDKLKEGIGHLNIKSRASALSGEVDIDSQPGRGMTATVTIPLTKSN